MGFSERRMEGHRYDVKFYMTALVFLIFDVEVVFLYPWAVQIRELGGFWFYCQFSVFGDSDSRSCLRLEKRSMEWE
ncbi:MAG: hypothetical protein Ct9H300mP28_34660 [Pseudomonadota bacterium]|nr:MAG: hypothetical protein Ct9H300mP28_34660 [Pseudomonadota bacterium]